MNFVCTTRSIDDQTSQLAIAFIIISQTLIFSICFPAKIDNLHGIDESICERYRRLSNCHNQSNRKFDRSNLNPHTYQFHMPTAKMYFCVICTIHQFNINSESSFYLFLDSRSCYCCSIGSAQFECFRVDRHLSFTYDHSP